METLYIWGGYYGSGPPSWPDKLGGAGRVGHSGIAISVSRTSLGTSGRWSPPKEENQRFAGWRVLGHHEIADPLLDHLHKILDARSVRGLRGLSFIGVFLATWGCRSMMPSAAPYVGSIHCTQLWGISTGLLIWALLSGFLEHFNLSEELVMDTRNIIPL